MSLKYRATPITNEPISLIIEQEYLDDESDRPSFEIISTSRQAIGRRCAMKTSRTVEENFSQQQARYPPPRSISSSQLRKNRTICMSNKSSRSPSPFVSRGRSHTPSLHFHQCNNEQCLSASYNRECCGERSLFTKEASPAFSISSFRSEQKVDLNIDDNNASSFKTVKRDLTPIMFNIKLNANESKASTSKNVSNTNEGEEFASSFVDENHKNFESWHDFGLRDCPSPFTSIETMAIKRNTRKKEGHIGRSEERYSENEKRSSRSTPSRSFSCAPKPTHRTVLLTKISPSSKTSQNIHLKVLKKSS